MAGEALVQLGWHLSEEGIQECVEDGRKDADSITKIALDTDLRDVGQKWLPEDINRGKVDYVQGPGVLQIQKLRNISAPKENEESHSAPRLLKITLTDGQVNCNAVEIESLKSVSMNTPPGTKIKLVGTIAIELGFLQLNNKNTRCLGGRVEKMVDSWQFKRTLAKQSRVNIVEGGPPPFVPFGQKIGHEKPIRRDNFKSLAVKTEKKVEDVEFEQQRQATIAEAMQAKEDGKTKTFGGGNKQLAQDKDVAIIVEMGFSIDDATIALKQNSGDVRQAINYLVNRGGSRGSRQQRPDRPERSDRPDRSDRPERGLGRGRKGTKEEDEGVDGTSRPSGPATLFDFLETKFSSKDGDSKSETKLTNSSSSPQSSHTKKSYSNSDSVKPQSDYRGGRRDDERSQASHNQSEQRGPRRTDGYQGRPQYPNQSEQRNQNYQNRRQNLPPRLANKVSRETGSGSNYTNFNSTDNRQSSDQQTAHNKSSYQHDRTQGKQNYNKYPAQRDTRNFGRTSQNYGNNNNNNSRYSNDRSDHYSNRPMPSSNNHVEEKFNGSHANTQNKQNDEGSQDYRYKGGERRDNRRPNNSYSTERTQPNRESHSYQERETTGPRVWRRGDKCVAKYWEDQQFYNAVIEAVGPDLPTCVVTFTEYGNSEEVLLTDIHNTNEVWTEPIQPGLIPTQQNFQSPPPPLPPQAVSYATTTYPCTVSIDQVFSTANQVFSTANQVTSIEYRRGGGGVSYRRQEKPPTYYQQPPIVHYDPGQ